LLVKKFSIFLALIYQTPVFSEAVLFHVRVILPRYRAIEEVNNIQQICRQGNLSFDIRRVRKHDIITVEALHKTKI
jgi:hypothetical protein